MSSDCNTGDLFPRQGRHFMKCLRWVPLVSSSITIPVFIHSVMNKTIWKFGVWGEFPVYPAKVHPL